MKLVVFMLLITFSLSAQNFNKDLIKLSNENQECLDKGKDMLGCSQKYYVQVDSLLNVTYKSIKKN